MPLIKTAPEGVTGSPEPVTLRGRDINVPRDMIHRQYNGVAIDRISGLWPEVHLRNRLIAAAKVFVGDMEKKGFSLLTPETEIKVFGPYHPRGRYAAFGEAKPTGWQQGEDPFEGLADFVIEAQFLAPNGHVTVGLDKE